MAGCGDCGCTCIIANSDGVPYPIGEDLAGNEAIVIPSPDARAGVFEFVHGSTLCGAPLYPFVAAVNGIVIAAAVVVLSVVDNAPVQIALRKNGMQVATHTLTAGTRISLWPGVAFPITLNQLEELETAVLLAGTLEPTVSVQVTLSVPAI